MKLPQWLAGYLLAALVVIATCVLLGLHERPPGWFEGLALFVAGGSTGAIINRTDPPFGGGA